MPPPAPRTCGRHHPQVHRELAELREVHARAAGCAVAAGAVQLQLVVVPGRRPPMEVALAQAVAAVRAVHAPQRLTALRTCIMVNSQRTAAAASAQTCRWLVAKQLDANKYEHARGMHTQHVPHSMQHTAAQGEGGDGDGGASLTGRYSGEARDRVDALVPRAAGLPPRQLLACLQEFFEAVAAAAAGVSV